MPASQSNREFEDERLDCGHYEYLSRAVPVPGGFLICSTCHAALANTRTEVRRDDVSGIRIGPLASAHTI